MKNNENISKDLFNQIDYYKEQLLNLLKTWYYYQTEVLQRILFSYDNTFGNIESEIVSKDKTARTLERKYQIISFRVGKGEIITRKSIEFIDKFLDKEKNRDTSHPNRRMFFHGNNNGFQPRNNILNTTKNDKADASQLYRQIVKRLHPDIVGENSALRSYWDNVQHCYNKYDVDRLQMFYQILCNDYNNNVEDIATNKNNLLKEIDELKKTIEKQKIDLKELKKQEPFCLEEKLTDNQWVAERKKQLNNKLLQINRKIMHHNRLINEVNIVKD